MTDVLMPALSPTMEDGTLAKWHVKEGDKVVSGDVIAEIETDKATMEVEAVDEGVVTAILVPEGAEKVKVNTPIARLGGNGSAEPAAPQPDQPKGAESKAPVQGASASDPRAARDQGQQEARERLADPSAKSPPASSQPAPNPPPAPSQPAASPSPAPSDPPVEKAETRIFASPLARRMAEKAGADLNKIKGSGPHGRIIAADMEHAGSAATAAQPAGSAPQPPVSPEPKPQQPAPKAAPTPAQPAQRPPAAAPQDAVDYLHAMGILPDTYTLQPLDGMRRTIAKRLTDSFRDVPHFPLTVDLEIDRLLDARSRLNIALEKSGAKVSVNDILIKASAMALKAVPAANASFTPKGIALHHHADVAVAVAIDGGLITPIIREAETRSLADISKAMKDLAARARDRKLKPEEFQGGTFSLSNLGMFGIRTFSSILNQPQGMILSAGAGEKRPVARGDALAVATVMTVTLTCDHRVVDGAIGAAWLHAFKTYVEDPVTMLA